MFGNKLIAKEMLTRSDESSSSSVQFPFNFFRSYNDIFNTRDMSSYYQLAKMADVPNRHVISSVSKAENHLPTIGNMARPPSGSLGLNFRDWTKRAPSLSQASIHPSSASDHSSISPLNRRQRGEKKAIPEEQKDGKYFERRKRNNEAAKRSRDARKLREDRIAFRASLLEQENAILKSQVYSLRDEISTLRQMIFPGSASLPMNSS